MEKVETRTQDKKKQKSSFTGRACDIVQVNTDEVRQVIQCNVDIINNGRYTY